MNLAQLLARAARVFPDRPAVLLGDKIVFSYRELADRSARLASHLRGELGLAAGDRVALFMTNNSAYLEILYAAWWAGLSVVPINCKLHPKEVEFILMDAGASVLFVSDDLATDMQTQLADGPMAPRMLVPGTPGYDGAFGAEPMEVARNDPDDLAWLFYTSGTTGRPKGVIQTHRMLFAMTACYFIDVDDVSSCDAIVYAAPMSHGAGLYNFAFVARAARHVVPASGGFEPAELVQLSRTVGRLCMFAAPTMVNRLTDHVEAAGAASDGFKTIVYGGGPMYADDILKALATMGPRFVQIYGQGESPMTITALSREHLTNREHPEWRARVGSVGIAQSFVEVRIVDADGTTLPTDQTGEIIVRGETVMQGYWRDPEATAKTLRGGWLWTGDMGSMDASGFLTLKDRSKDVIISGGSNIYPREVEEVLLCHPDVREISVIGQPDPEWGEIVVAFVVGDDLTAEALDAFCLEQIARFKRPKRYHFVQSLPKNNYGKVLKTVLRELLVRGDMKC